MLVVHTQTHTCMYAHTHTHHTFTHARTHRWGSHIGLSLLQDLVVLAEGGEEDEGGDVLKTVNPLPTLRLLSAHIHNPVRGGEGRGGERDTE